MEVVSFFAGCGGLDLGFRQAGFHVAWANEIDPSVHDTYAINHPDTTFCLGDFRCLRPEDIPDCDGFIGGPPCQAWSVAGKQRGLDDSRGKLFLSYIGMINAKKPGFFLIENVKGILSDKFKGIFNDFLKNLESSGYDVYWKLLDSADYGVPQNRERIFIIGFRNDLKINYRFPKPTVLAPIPLIKAIGDIRYPPRKFHNHTVDSANTVIPNHDVYAKSFGSFYRSGNRRRSWERPSFTIHATAENIPLHPSSPNMIFHGHENWEFQTDKINDYRRLSVRECARIQTFPDSYKFEGTDIRALYRMIGNAVPPRLGKVLAKSIMDVLSGIPPEDNKILKSSNKHDLKNACVLTGYYKNKRHLELIEGNRLYYVRSDGRKGSMFKQDCQVMPDYLLAYHNGDAFFYEMTRDEPVLADSSYLKSLGFEVNGDLYLCFYLKKSDRIRIEDLVPFTLNFTFDRNSYRPQFYKLGDLINAKQ